MGHKIFYSSYDEYPEYGVIPIPSTRLLIRAFREGRKAERVKKKKIKQTKGETNG